MADVARLEQDHIEAKAAYRKDKSDANRREYEKTKDKLVKARREAREAEGRQGFQVVTD